MKQRASMTVEAAFVLPIFLFAMLLLAYLGQMAKCQDSVQWALTRVAREASAEYGATKNKLLLNKAYYSVKLATYLDSSALSVSLLQSHICEDGDEMDFVADYRMELPFRLLTKDSCTFRARVHTRAFTGITERGKESEGSGEQDVYITETGRVYHTVRSCTYLKLSISQLKFNDIGQLRNEGGGKYKPCEKCSKESKLSGKADVWITNFGDRYHISRSCSGLKRTIKKIKLSEAGSRTPCSKCGGGKGGKYGKS